MNSLTPLYERIVGRGREEEDASHDSPNVDAAVGDEREATIQENPDDAGLEEATSPRVSIEEARRESSEFQQQEQDTMKGHAQVAVG